jgi:hypothetical protein
VKLLAWIVSVKVAALVLPAVSVTVMTMVWEPIVRLGSMKLQVAPSLVVEPAQTPSTEMLTVVPASAVPVSVGVVSAVLDGLVTVGEDNAATVVNAMSSP